MLNFFNFFMYRGHKYLELPYVVKGMDVSFSGLLSFIEVRKHVFEKFCQHVFVCLFVHYVSDCALLWCGCLALTVMACAGSVPFLCSLVFNLMWRQKWTYTADLKRKLFRSKETETGWKVTCRWVTMYVHPCLYMYVCVCACVCVCVCVCVCLFVYELPIIINIHKLC